MKKQKSRWSVPALGAVKPFNGPPLTPTEENKIIKRVSVVTITGNTALSVLKLLAGVAGKSGALVSDAVHSISDIFTTIIAFVGVKLSRKEADKGHPYGHERLESAASFLLGAILLLVGVGIGFSAIKAIVTGAYQSYPTALRALPLAAAALSILTKEGMFWYTRYYARRLNSSAFMADAWHHRSDAFSSVGSLIGVTGAMLGLPVLDSAASVVISLFVIKIAYDILKDAMSKLLDASCGEVYENEILEAIASQPGVAGVDLLRTRKFGNKVYVDSEIAVDGNLTLKEAHAIAHEAHDRVEKEFTTVKHIMIHVNPVEAAVTSPREPAE